MMKPPLEEWMREGIGVLGANPGDNRCDHKNWNGTGSCMRCGMYLGTRPIEFTASAEKQMKWKYGIDADEYNARLEKQKGLCAICFSPSTSVGKDKRYSKLVVDHCHESKDVRGLLCAKCNAGLGFFDDDQNRLFQAIRYLRHGALDRTEEDQLKEAC